MVAAEEEGAFMESAEAINFEGVLVHGSVDMVTKTVNAGRVCWLA